MKKLSLKYRLFRFLFGIVLMFVGFKGLTDYSNIVSIMIKNNEQLKQKEVTEFILSSFGEYIFNIITSFLELIVLNAADIVFFINGLILFGGLLCSFGHRISKYFLFSAVLLDIALIHNIVFFSTDNGRGLMLKFIAYIGGISYII